jgi:hypothetical protein
MFVHILYLFIENAKNAVINFSSRKFLSFYNLLLINCRKTLQIFLFNKILEIPLLFLFFVKTSSLN